jgi:hypothetical protein
MVSKFDFKFINLCRYAEENLPILFLVIDNGRAINTFTKDVAQNQEVFNQGKHYGGAVQVESS